jgi:hypothetical protein
MQTFLDKAEKGNYQNCLSKGEAYIMPRNADDDDDDEHESTKSEEIEVSEDEYICFREDGRPVVFSDAHIEDMLFGVQTKEAQVLSDPKLLLSQTGSIKQSHERTLI